MLWREASRVMGSAWHGHRCTHTRIHTHPPHMTHTCAQPSHVHAPCTHRHTLTCVCVVHTQVVPHRPRPGPCAVRTLRCTRARSRAHTRCSRAHLATLPARCRGNGMVSRRAGGEGPVRGRKHFRGGDGGRPAPGRSRQVRGPAGFSEHGRVLWSEVSFLAMI